MAEEREISFEQWATFDVKESTLKETVKKGVLPAKKSSGGNRPTVRNSRHRTLEKLCPHQGERSKPSFQHEGQTGPNREDPDSIEFQTMYSQMYKVFSTGIVIDYGHNLPVIPYSLMNPTPPENESIISNPLAMARQSPRRSPRNKQPTGGPSIKTPQKGKRSLSLSFNVMRSYLEDLCKQKYSIRRREKLENRTAL
uniref:Retrotransposon protein, putative, unclassified n=1 Tax=Oryza sativa subsp. japonica TaxID=39947 RepID=Q2QZ83_ORYSJ|nr:retrotransposon protein, putative, unclassified [Oryza sativa Japonica Group]